MMAKPPVSSNKATVFIVDDHPLVRDWLSRLINDEVDLEVCGFADNADEASMAIARLHPAIVRPGRCIAQVEVGKLTASEARKWLGDRALPREVEATLAELLSLRQGARHEGVVSSTASIGQYL